MVHYKLARKDIPVKKSKNLKWYAIPVVEELLDTDTVCRQASRNTIFSEFEISGSLDLISRFLPGALQQGNSVRLGTFRLSFGSEGVDRVEDFSTNMIRSPRIIFTPSPELAAAIQSGLHLENGGVVGGGFSFSSFKDYRQYKASKRGDTENPE